MNSKVAAALANNDGSWAPRLFIRVLPIIFTTDDAGFTAFKPARLQSCSVDFHLSDLGKPKGCRKPLLQTVASLNIPQ
jgi:hypothetical protein